MNKIIPTTSYTELLKSRDKYIDYAKSLGIYNKLHPNNRIFQAFNLIEKFIPVYQDPRKRDEFLHRNNYDAQVTYALSEMLELKHILDSLSDCDDDIMPRKILELSKGTLSPVKETSSNNLPRNTQFELSLLADFLSYGMDAHLTSSNPDILLTTNQREYNIECKRINSVKMLNSNFKAAANQVAKVVEGRPDEVRGLVAISITKLINNPDQILSSQTPLSAYNFIDNIMTEFAYTNSNIWKKTSRLPGRKLPGVILHYNCVLYSDTGPGMSNLSFRMITNTRGSDPYFSELEQDIGPLMAMDFLHS